MVELFRFVATKVKDYNSVFDTLGQRLAPGEEDNLSHYFRVVILWRLLVFLLQVVMWKFLMLKKILQKSRIFTLKMISLAFIHFDLWVEKTRLEVNMTLPGAVAALLHLVFIFYLRYPEVFYNLMLLLLK